MILSRSFPRRIGETRSVREKPVTVTHGVTLFSSSSQMLLASARTFSAIPGLGRRAASAIASNYSKAIFDASAKKSPQTLTKVATDLSNTSAAIKSDPEIAELIRNPTLSSKERANGLQKLFTKLEGIGAKKEPVSDITKNLLTILSENGRLPETQEVIEEFHVLLAQYKGELTVTVTSAAPLDKATLTRLEGTLKQSQTAQVAKVLKIENKVFFLKMCSLHRLELTSGLFRSILVFLVVLLLTLARRRLT